MATVKYLDLNGLKSFSDKIQALIDNKLGGKVDSATVETLQAEVTALKNLIEADSDGAINKFNEIVNFLAGIEDTQTLAPLVEKLAGIEAGAQKNTVTSVAGKTGVVALGKADVGLGLVNNTPDLDKPISKATQAALDTKLNDADISAISTEEINSLFVE